jgi:hypothetical protein
MGRMTMIRMAGKWWAVKANRRRRKHMRMRS